MTTLSNNEIEVEIDTKRLILNADKKMLEGACYQLTLGNVYYDLTEDGKRFELGKGQKVLIKPGHRVVLITAEEFDVPADILVRVVSKGSLFSIGLSPVATYADPGFAGNLGIVTENVSDKYVELPQGEPIAKADFTRLSSPATKLYQGQHGFKAGIWPIKTHLQKVHSDVKGDHRILTEKEEAFAILPAATRTVILGLEKSVRWTLITLAGAGFINAVSLFLVESEWLGSFYGIVGNLIASAIAGVALYLAGGMRRV